MCFDTTRPLGSISICLGFAVDQPGEEELWRIKIALTDLAKE